MGLAQKDEKSLALEMPDKMRLADTRCLPDG